MHSKAYEFMRQCLLTNRMVRLVRLRHQRTFWMSIMFCRQRKLVVDEHDHMPDSFRYERESCSKSFGMENFSLWSRTLYGIKQKYSSSVYSLYWLQNFNTFIATAKGVLRTYIRMFYFTRVKRSFHLSRILKLVV